MSYLESTLIKSDDSPSIDAFGRWRVSNPHTVFDSKLLTEDSVNEYWSGRGWNNATGSYNKLDSSYDLIVGTQSGSRYIHQTKRKFVYEPGKSLLIIMTGVFGVPTQNNTRYIMYGNDNYALGFYMSGSSFGVIKRNYNASGSTETLISQSNWNVDTFDGNGPSGHTHDPSHAQIYFLDMEWLGVGRVRFGIYESGTPHYVHSFNHINELSTTYISNPNLQIRYELVNSATAPTTSSMKHICSSVVSEGGSENLGISRVVTNKATAIAVPASSHCGLLFVRQITSSQANGYKENTPRVSPSKVSVFVNDTEDSRWSLQLNPVVATSGSLTYTRIGSSSIEYATGSSATLITTSGREIDSGYVPGGTVSAGSNMISSIIDPFFSLGEDLYGNRDTLVLSLENLEGSAIAGAYGAMSIKEIL